MRYVGPDERHFGCEPKLSLGEENSTSARGSAAGNDVPTSEPALSAALTRHCPLRAIKVVGA